MEKASGRLAGYDNYLFTNGDLDTLITQTVQPSAPAAIRVGSVGDSGQVDRSVAAAARERSRGGLPMTVRASEPRVLLFAELGVTSRFWEESVPILVASGVEVVLATLRQRGPLHDALDALGCPTLSLNCRSSRGYPWAAVRLAAEIRRRRIDIVHSCESIPAMVGGFAGLIAGRGRRIFHRQHTVLEGGGPQVVFCRVGSRLAHLVMACSHSSAWHAHEIHGVPWSRIRVAYNGIAPLRLVSREETHTLREQLRIPADSPVISIVAHLRPVKGHRTLLESMPRVASALGRRPHVVIVGSGPDETALRQTAKSVTAAAVHFVGHQEDVALWFSLADVVAMPSYNEPFGLSAVEAMSCTRPLVASRVDGLVEIIEDGVSGLLVEPRDPDALADGLLRVLRDPVLATRLASEGRQRSLLFTLERMVSSWRACYEEVLAGPCLPGGATAPGGPGDGRISQGVPLVEAKPRC